MEDDVGLLINAMNSGEGIVNERGLHWQEKGRLDFKKSAFPPSEAEALLATSTLGILPPPSRMHSLSDPALLILLCLRLCLSTLRSPPAVLLFSGTAFGNYVHVDRAVFNRVCFDRARMRRSLTLDSFLFS
ncbi:hypothetical protein Ancab_021892 [Ancistrocladus abbreviatus]